MVSVSFAGIRVHMWAVSLRDATRYQPHRLRPHPDHQAGVALPLGCRARLHLHAGHHRHLFCHRHLRPVQRHANRAGVGAGDELRAADGNLPVLRHHVPDDRDARCGSVLVPEDLPGTGHVLQLCSAAHQDQQDTPHLRAREEICNGTQVRILPSGPLCIQRAYVLDECSGIKGRCKCVLTRRPNLHFFLTELLAIIIHHLFFIHYVWESWTHTHLLYCLHSVWVTPWERSG